MNGTILVVDDESEIVDVLSDIFSDRDYKVLKGLQWRTSARSFKNTS